MPDERDVVRVVTRLSTLRGSRRAAAAEIIALGLLVVTKWDRATSGQAADFIPGPEPLAAHGTVTDAELAQIRIGATDLLAECATERRIDWHGWWLGVGGGVVASLIWSVLLVGIGLIAVRSSGGDVGAMWRGMMAAHPG